MLKYAVTNHKYDDNKLEPEYLYPLAEHKRWVNWSQHMCKRHTVHDQRNVYSNQNQKDANLNENELQEIDEGFDCISNKVMILKGLMIYKYIGIVLKDGLNF